MFQLWEIITGKYLFEYVWVKCLSLHKKPLPSCHDFFPGRYVDFHQSERFLFAAQPMGGQEVVTVSVGVIPQEEAFPNNITKL